MQTIRPRAAASGYGRRLGLVVGVTPVIAFGAALMLRSDIGVGPIDMATVGIAHRLGVAVGTGSLLLAVGLGVLASIWRVPPGGGTVIGLAVFAPALTAFYELLRTPPGALAPLQFGAGLMIAGSFVAVVVAADVGVGPPEALMLAIARRTGWPIGRVRVLQDVAVGVLGLLLGAPLGPGTVAVAVLFGPIIAAVAPVAERIVALATYRPRPRLSIDRRSL